MLTKIIMVIILYYQMASSRTYTVMVKYNKLKVFLGLLFIFGPESITRKVLQKATEKEIDLSYIEGVSHRMKCLKIK